MNIEQLSKAFSDHASEISKTKDKSAKFRAVSYTRAAHVIENAADNNTKVTKDMINKMELSDYMKQKAISYIEGTNTSKSKSKSKTRSKSKSKAKSTDTTELLRELTEFMGIGEERAKKLIDAGIKHVNELHKKKFKELLPEETKTFIDLKPQQQIPHEHIKLLEPYIMQASDKNIKIIITGSYRRQKPTSSDIDLMIVSNNENAIDLLHKRLTTILDGKIYPYSKGIDKMSFVVDMSDLTKKSSVYKIDAFRTLPENEISMLLYSTGSKEFNIYMRGKAKKLGYLLNQKGLFKDNELVPNLKTEKDYFDILDMPFKAPKDRI